MTKFLLHKMLYFTIGVFLIFHQSGIRVSIAGTKTLEIQQQVIKTIDVGRQTQIKEDAWEGEKAELLAMLQGLQAEEKHLSKVKTDAVKQLEMHQRLVCEAERKIKEAELINAQMQSYLESIIVSLEDDLKLDLPFLIEERTNRIASVKSLLARPDKSAGEKYRRVMEALQIETEYGRTVEVYQKTIDLNKHPTLVDILRMGRLSLYFQTIDGKIAGKYDRAAKAWIQLPSRYQRNIKKAVKMAMHEKTLGLARLPVGRIIVP